MAMVVVVVVVVVAVALGCFDGRFIHVSWGSERVDGGEDRSIED